MVKSLMCGVNKMGPKMDPRGTPLNTPHFTVFEPVKGFPVKSNGFKAL